MSAITRLFVLAALCTATLGTGCDALRFASKEECAEVVDHVVALSASEEAGDGFGGRILEAGAQVYVRASGDRSHAVRQCMGKMLKVEASCILSSDSVREARRCDL